MGGKVKLISGILTNREYIASWTTKPIIPKSTYAPNTNPDAPKTANDIVFILFNLYI